MRREKYLLGATKDGEIVFGEFEISHRNGKAEFTAMFDTVAPFTENEIESAIDYYESYIDCLDKSERYTLCERYDCSPSQLAQEMVEIEGSDPQTIRDCSTYPEIIDVDGTDWYFEAMSGGQHDTRGEMEVYTNKEAYDKLHELWDLWHLNTMHAGTPKQELFLTTWKKSNVYNYDEACKALADAGLLVDDGYKYGSSWLTVELPQSVFDDVAYLEKILSEIDEEKWISDYIREKEDAYVQNRQR